MPVPKHARTSSSCAKCITTTLMHSSMVRLRVQHLLHDKLNEVLHSIERLSSSNWGSNSNRHRGGIHLVTSELHRLSHLPALFCSRTGAPPQTYLQGNGLDGYRTFS